MKEFAHGQPVAELWLNVQSAFSAVKWLGLYERRVRKTRSSLSKLAQAVRYFTQGKCYGNRRDTWNAERDVSRSCFFFTACEA